jgi:acyl-CoA thioester hydrolase
MTEAMEATTEIDIPFHHLDPMRIVWHGYYFEYFEAARRELLRSINYDYHQMEESGYAWPIIDCHCRYVKPITYGMRIRVNAKIMEHKFRLKIAYKIYDCKTNTCLCKATTTQVGFDIEKKQMCIGSPEALLKRLER